MEKQLNNCTVCLASYAPYRTGPDEDIGAYMCVLSVYELIDGELVRIEPKGVCQFHNPASRLFVATPLHA